MGCGLAGGTMAINNAFQANDWNIRPFLVLVLSLLLAFWGSIALDALGFTIPLIRQITGFLILTFVPGILILRILRIHHLGTVKTNVYAAGISLATLMFAGFFVNIAYPLFGIFRPFSLWPLVATISILVGILCFLAWLRDWDFAAPISINLHEILSTPVLAFSLLPFGAIAGTYLMNFYDTNTLQMILLPIIALVPVVIVCTQFVPKKYYPYAVFSIAITLLYHTALISTYIWGWDIQYEYYLTNTVIQNSIWDFTDYSSCNAMLSLMTLAPIYSILLGIGLEWIFKVIYPFFFALVPLGLYVVFRRQTNEKVSFLACFFFMSVFVFFTEMVSLARQEVAELFLVLILLSMIDRGMSRQQRSVLLLTFTALLIVSHYGLSYIFMLLLLIALTIVTVEYHLGVLDRVNWFLNQIRENTGRINGLTLQKASFKPSIISLRFVIWYGLFLLAWYIYVASSSSFESIVYLARSMLRSISSDLLNPDAAQGLAIIANEAVTPLREVAKCLHLLTIFFIVVGFAVTVLARPGRTKFYNHYLLLSCGALGICICGVVLPYFASALNTSRLYQISLILLAPFGIIGGTALTSRLRRRPDSRDPSLHIIAIFLGIFLLFNCGWAFEVGHEESNFALNNSLDCPVFSKQEIYGSLWLTDAKDGRPVAADTYRRLLLSGFVGRPACHDIQTVVSGNADYYAFIGQHNILQKRIVVTRMTGVVSSMQFIEVAGLHEGKNAIYNNGGSRIYYPNSLQVLFQQ
jgi:uncharacterized membrane protein